MRIDKLNADFVKGNDGDHWRDVFDRLNFGDMPPAKEPALKKEDRELMTAWLVQERRRAALAKNQATHFRRLTRCEYERTLQDLLGLPIEFAARLPEDGQSKDGFRNDGDALRMSPLQYETYLQIADDALAEAIVTGPPPVVHRYRLSVGEKLEKFEVTAPAQARGSAGRIVRLRHQERQGVPHLEHVQPSGQQDRWDGTLAPSAIRRFGEAAVQMPERCSPSDFSRRSARAKRGSRCAPRASSRAQEPTAPACLFLTVAMGSTNFHGVELKTDRRTDRHRSHRLPHLRVSRADGERLGPEHWGR